MTRDFARAKGLLEKAVANGELPGLVAVAGDRQTWGYVAVYGHRRLGGAAMTLDTHFDLASLTKVVATLPGILHLVDEGDLKLSDMVGRFFSNAGWFQTPSLADVNIKDLLTHSSGLPAWKPLFALVSERRTAIANVLQTGLERPGRIVYSDLGFIVLGAILERVSGLRQDVFFEHYTARALGLTEISFGPIRDLPVAATEDCGWRDQLLEGVVHDENAFVMEGVAGHAGLFGTAADLASYAQAWLRLDERLASRDVLRLAISEQVKDKDHRFGLGWMLAQGGSSAGALASPSAYGHTGFTGTSLWLEPEQGWFAALLTNRVHPTRRNDTNIHHLRRRFHEAISEHFT